MDRSAQPYWRDKLAIMVGEIVIGAGDEMDGVELSRAVASAPQLVDYCRLGLMAYGVRLHEEAVDAVLSLVAGAMIRQFRQDYDVSRKALRNVAQYARDQHHWWPGCAPDEEAEQL